MTIYDYETDNNLTSYAKECGFTVNYDFTYQKSLADVWNLIEKVTVHYHGSIIISIKTQCSDSVLSGKKPLRNDKGVYTLCTIRVAIPGKWLEFSYAHGNPVNAVVLALIDMFSDENFKEWSLS